MSGGPDPAPTGPEGRGKPANADTGPSAAAGPPAGAGSSAGESTGRGASAGQPTSDKDSAVAAGDERAEIQRLREENARLRAQQSQLLAGEGRGGPGGKAGVARRRRHSWRTAVSALLIVLGCLLAPVAVLGVWSANQVTNTDRYVANMAPLIHEPAVQHALTDKLTLAITDKLNVQGLADSAANELNARGNTRIAALLKSFAPSIAGAVNGFIHTQVAKIVASPAVARVWTQVNRIAHAQIDKALSGQGNGAITITNGQVTIGLGPFIDQAKRNLSNRGLTIVNKIPPVNPTIALFSAKYLVKAQSAYRLVRALKFVLPILALLLLAAGVYIARQHRRALIGAGLGLAASMLVLAIGLAVGRSIYLNSVPSTALPADAAAVLFDTLVRFIKQGLRVLLVLGLVVAVAAFFTGPSVTAVKTRAGAKAGIDWIRSSGEHAGLSTGSVGRWTYAHRGILRISAVTLAVLIFVFWGQPTGLVVLVLAILLVVVLGLIELIGRPPRAEPGVVGPQTRHPTSGQPAPPESAPAQPAPPESARPRQSQPESAGQDSASAVRRLVDLLCLPV